MGVYETGIRKFKGINMSILLHPWARWALKAQLIPLPPRLSLSLSSSLPLCDAAAVTT